MIANRDAGQLWKAAALALAATMVVAAVVLAHAWRWNAAWPVEVRRLWLHGAFATQVSIAILAAAWVAFGPGRHLAGQLAGLFQ